MILNGRNGILACVSSYQSRSSGNSSSGSSSSCIMFNVFSWSSVTRHSTIANGYNVYTYFWVVVLCPLPIRCVAIFIFFSFCMFFFLLCIVFCSFLLSLMPSIDSPICLALFHTVCCYAFISIICFNARPIIFDVIFHLALCKHILVLWKFFG